MVVQSPCFRAPFGKVDVAGAALLVPPHAADAAQTPHQDAVHANLPRRGRHARHCAPPHCCHRTVRRGVNSGGYFRGACYTK